MNKVHCFNLMSDWKSLEEAVSSEPALELEFLSLDIEEALYEIKDLSVCLTLCIVNGEGDLKSLARLKDSFKREFNKSHKFIPVTTNSGQQLFNKIQKLGFNDVLDWSLTSKAIRLKLDRWIGQVSKMENAQASQASEKKKASIVWENATDNFDDFWVIKEEKCKKVLQRFSIKMFGPGPYVGKWKEISKSQWSFEINEENRSDFLPLEGGWMFSGDQKPEFVWAENNWLFVGEKPSLLYSNPEGEEDYKFKFLENDLYVRKNSMPALNRERTILNSFEKNVSFNNEKPKETKELKLQEMLREDVSTDKETALTEEKKDSSRELGMEPTILEENSSEKDLTIEANKRSGKELKLEPTIREDLRPENEIALDKENLGEMLELAIEEIVESEERYKFRKMCASPILSLTLLNQKISKKVQFYDVDDVGVYVLVTSGDNHVEEKSRLLIDARYYNINLALQFDGDLKVLSREGDLQYLKLLVDSTQRPSLAKLNSFFKLRKKIVYSFVRVGMS